MYVIGSAQTDISPEYLTGVRKDAHSEKSLGNKNL